MYPFLRSLAIVVVVTLGVWFVAELLGFRMSLFASLAISVVLTLVLNAGTLLRPRRRVVVGRPRWRW